MIMQNNTNEWLVQVVLHYIVENISATNFRLDLGFPVHTYGLPMLSWWPEVMISAPDHL